MISFLVCAFNEQEFIRATVNTINKSVSRVEFIDKFEIVIVNDGSDDLTEKVIKELTSEFENITYCKNEKNLGYGASVKKGLQHIKYPKCMLLPGDDDISMDAIVAALKHLRSTDLVLTFPLNTEDRSKLRNILSKIYTLIYIVVFDCCVNYINGPVILPTDKVRNLKLRSNRHGINSEIVSKLLHSDISYYEVPVYFRFNTKARGTISVRNLFDVTISFIRLFIEMKILDRDKFSKISKRKHIY